MRETLDEQSLILYMAFYLNLAHQKAKQVVVNSVPIINPEARGISLHLPNAQPLLNRLLLPLPINILFPTTSLALSFNSNRRLIINLRLLSLLALVLLTRLLQSMRNSELSPLLRILYPSLPLLPRFHRAMLNVHPEHRKSLRDRIDRMSKKARPGWEQVRKGTRVLEVRRESECCQAC